MDYDHEINAVAGRVSGLQVLLVRICANLAQSHVSFDPLLRTAFSEAANYVEDRAMQAGDKPHLAFFDQSLRMIEELRSAVFGGDKPSA